ncbi:TPA: hypothetical protein P2Q98_003651 [Aeromonas veronii]|uniref:hypothetical protein n=1 Tax=Aeromonas TaxID=642 RepID=UPI001F198BDA|nr:hypothetical protein [Aeromonas veronii]MCF5900108.1 hypothetical protein [Aeromonas veronii]HDO1329771.1 hypothetical protein [Aeromonas veronii]HDO1335424.1 hypothetical protein [Aeromonas veronii]HDO1339853.1 hypothetical protein [Aeromonas veronii]HDO1344294.1 hypothetical protein [Aeromonas veronii]
MSDITFKIDTPVKTIERYASDTGIPVGSVKKMVERGQIPILPKSSPRAKPMINMVAIYAAAYAAIS